MASGDLHISLTARHRHIDALELAKENLSRDITRLNAVQLLALLQRWVSELEPQMVVDHRTGTLLGLGYADQLILPVERIADPDF